tara:strand:- start:112 stop:711 length:600 start_codon:yes stop_codon:yes gene_type:complete
MDQNITTYIPEAARAQIHALLDDKYLHIIVKKARKTRHGDYRKLKNGGHQITVNDNLNPCRFLVTLLHEIAHYHAYRLYGNNIQPHGLEWKLMFKKIMLPFLRPDVFPNKILALLAKYIKNPKATTDSDLHLSLALKSLDPPNHKIYIFEVDPGSTFIASNGKMYKKGKKRRTRYECIAIDSGRMYAFNPNAEVEQIDV